LAPRTPSAFTEAVAGPILPDVANRKQWPFGQSELRRAGLVKQLCSAVSHSAMTSHHPHPPPPVHFPTSGERGPFPFPTSASMAALHREGTGLPEELSEEELRLMADTMPGEGPGD
jgi:hypothetical protein